MFTISKSEYDAVIFDLDGVVTKTAKAHAAAWKKLFDEYLRQRANPGGGEFQPFEITTDYRAYVDGKPRYDGVKSFLESRGIELPYGTPDDPPGKETVCGLGNKKNELFREHLHNKGVEVYDLAVELIHNLRSLNFKTAIVSSSKNCADVLEAAGIAGLFDVRVDGRDSAKLGLEGKPAPDIFLEAAKRLAVQPRRSIVVEDAISGVEAGRRGKFGLVIGMDRTGHAAELSDHGADLVVSDMSRVTVIGDEATAQELASALDSLEDIARRARNRKIAMFLDYDGTLTPIVDTPDKAVLSAEMRQIVEELATLCTIGVISGRDLADVRALVGIDSILYAGSHGFDIAGPEGLHIESQQGTDFLPALEEVERALRRRLDEVEGALVERKKFSIAAHYRLVDEARVSEVERSVDEAMKGHPELRKTFGKKVFDLQPNIEWNKGKALLWVLEALKLDRPDVLPVYMGDDLTDEDAFAVLTGRGIGIVVGREPRPTKALYALADPREVKQFLEAIISMQRGGN